MSLPLIGPDQDFAIWAVLIALAGFGFWCERFPWGRKYSGVMLLMGVARFRKRTSFMAGITMGQVSEFSLILAALGYGLGYIDNEIVG